MERSKLLRMDNVAIVVNDLDAAVKFFVELGMEVEGSATVEGDWVDRVVGLENVKSDITVLKTPDGHSKIELTKYQQPQATSSEQNTPVNALGKHRIMFAVTDINETLARLKTHGAELVGEVVQFQDMYLLCYIRGPEGIIIALAQQLGDKTIKEVLEKN